MTAPPPSPSSPAELELALRGVGYLADRPTATAAFLASALERPLLVEGPAGVGKTDLARALAESRDAMLIRLQCYEGIDESRALYEWAYAKQLLYTQILRDRVDELVTGATSLDDAVDRLDQAGDGFFSERFLLERPLLAALRAGRDAVLLLDEIDKADPEFEAFLLEVLSDFQVSIPELGTIRAEHRPLVVLTSNRSRELSDPLTRRCLHLSMTFPDPAREREILDVHLPDLDDNLARAVVGAVAAIRALDLRKVPSVGEVIDWARSLALLGRGVIDESVLKDTLGALLKHRDDVQQVTEKAADIVRASVGDP